MSESQIFICGEPVSWGTVAVGCACFVAGMAVGYGSWALNGRSLARERAFATVTDMYVYPIKSCRGIRVSRARVTPRGLEGDRLFMVTDGKGQMQTMRTLPRMATVRPLWNEAGDLVLTAPEMPDFVLHASEFATGARVKATVFGYDCHDAIDQGEAVNAWFSQALGTSGARLVRMPDDHRRPVESGHVKEDGIHHTSFSDGYPYLLANSSSLDFVRIESGISTLSMTRFRPNVVVSGPSITAFAEDFWAEIQLGTCRFEVAKKCTRCQVPRVDPDSGVPDKEEPSKTLRKHHANLFGQNMVAVDFGGEVRVGDPIRVLKQSVAESVSKR